MSDSLQSDLCYVLKTLRFKERDLILVLFSETRGKFSAIARNGIQSRRFGGSLNLFTASQFEIDPKTIKIQEFSEESLLSVASAQSKQSFEALSQSFEKLSAASSMNEILIRILPSFKPSPEVFKLYSNSLFALTELPTDRAISITNAFILKMTQWLGVQPSLTRCLHCQKPLNEVFGDEVYPQVSKGAWLCEHCIPSRTEGALTKLVILDAYHSMLHPIRKIEFEANAGEHENLLDFLEKHLQYFVPGFDKTPLSSIRFLKSPQSLI